MANIMFAEQENAHLHPPTLKMRQRLQSAPGIEMSTLFSDFAVILVCMGICINLFFFSPPEKLKSPMTAKTFATPLPLGRKAFAPVNKKISTPAVNAQEKLKPQVGINHDRSI